jgi:DNA-binding HxlR family transcriptional regulator
MYWKMRTEIKKPRCKIDSVVDIIGRKWNLLIIWQLRDSTLRFSELQSRMCGINSKTITKHLRDLEQHTIITRTVYPEVPPRVEYSLTERGRAILPIIDAMLEWGGAYLNQEDYSKSCEMVKDKSSADGT